MTIVRFCSVVFENNGSFFLFSGENASLNGIRDPRELEPVAASSILGGAGQGDQAREAGTPTKRK